MARNQFTHESFDPALLMPITIENYWSHVHKTDGCWLWIGSLTLAGYGSFHSPYIPTRSAHRIAWILSGRDLAATDTLDHLCGTRNCVNPEHLDPCPLGVNLERSDKTISAINSAKTHCNAGHVFDEKNTYYVKTGGRCCRKCRYLRVLAWTKEKRDSDPEFRKRDNARKAAAKRRRRVLP